MQPDTQKSQARNCRAGLVIPGVILLLVGMAGPTVSRAGVLKQTKPVQISGSSPFSGCTADQIPGNIGLHVIDTVPDVSALATRAAVWDRMVPFQDAYSHPGPEAGNCDYYGLPCDDGNPCTDDKCGRCCDCDIPCVTPVCYRCCVHEPTTKDPVCDDGNACTASDQCSNGACVGSPVSEGSCDDGNLCTVGDRCLNGRCAGDVIACDDGSRCTVDSCDSTAGTCSYAPFNCDDGNACTTDTCDPATGCLHAGLPGEAGPVVFIDQVTLVWNQALGALISNTYRGTIPADRFNGRSPAYDHGCFESDDAQLNGTQASVDAEDPPVGTSFYYLVDGELQGCEGSLGTASNGAQRMPVAFCQTPPP